MSGDATEARAEVPDPELEHLVRDGAVGVVAGGIGTALLTVLLAVAQAVGLFSFDWFAAFAEFVFLDAMFPPVLAGFVIYAVMGVFGWPLLFASLEPYLPGQRFRTRGIAFSVPLWVGFLVGTVGVGVDAPLSGTQVAAYAAVTFLAHAIYGSVLGTAVGSFFSDQHHQRSRVLRGEVRTAPDAMPSGAAATGAGTGTGTATGADATAGGDPTGNDTAETQPSQAAATAAGADRADADTTTDGAAAATTAAEPAAATEEPSAETDDEEDEEADPVAFRNAPAAGTDQDAELTPLLQFERAIERIEASLDDEATIAELETVKEEYRKLTERNPARRQSLANDLEGRLANLAERIDDENRSAQLWVDSMRNRLRRYVNTRREPSENLYVSGARLLVDGTERPVSELQTETPVLEAIVVNQGERSGALVRVDFYHENGVLLRSDYLSAGYVEAGGKSTLSTRVYVPSVAADYEVTALDPFSGQEFLVDFDSSTPSS